MDWPDWSILYIGSSTFLRKTTSGKDKDMFGDLPKEVAVVLTYNLRGDLDTTIREHVLNRDKKRCTNCGLVRPSQRGLTYDGRKIYLTIDHIKPRRDSGNNHPRNLRVLCNMCHEFLNINDRLPDIDETPWSDNKW